MTMYLASHYIQAWVLPPGFNLLLMILGFLIAFFWPLPGKLMIFIGSITLWLLCTPIVAYNLINLLQNQYPLLPVAALTKEKQDAILVLGGGDAIDAEYGNKHTVSDFTLHRLAYAAYLHHQTNLPIIVSGGKPSGAIDSEADLMANILRDNYHINVTIKENKSFTTADESQLIIPILKQHQFNKIYLVTNAWHMPRSIFIFHRAGIHITPAPMGYFIYGPGYSLLSFFPNMNALYASSLAIHEFIGLAWYRIHYAKQYT